tara:strand:- start:1934 stop:2176 length:243 start_codon:yes stop_codon:yes gene_type:complete
MNITEFVADRLKDATESELKDIVANGIELDDCDMLEALENEFLCQAKEKLTYIPVIEKNNTAIVDQSEQLSPPDQLDLNF